MGLEPRQYNGAYTGDYLNRVAFPMGGIGAGMVCLEGTGALSHVSIRNRPDVFNEPQTFAAIAVKGKSPKALVLEGPVPMWKAFGNPGSGNGQGSKTWGLPRFSEASFEARFPFGTVVLRDGSLPIEAKITGWSPFIPGNADDSSLPVAALEYELTNAGRATLEAVFSFNSRNFMATGSGGDAVLPGTGKGFTLWQPSVEDKPWETGAFAVDVLTDEPVDVNCRWFRGGWFDPLTMIWNEIAACGRHAAKEYESGAPSPGGSVFIPLSLSPGESHTVTVLLTWYCPVTAIRHGNDPEFPPGCTCEPALPGNYAPRYATLFNDIRSAETYWAENYHCLKEETAEFTQAFYDNTLPPEVNEAVAANLTILKSPTVLRQADGRLWAWEGCSDASGCCAGSCTHVWNYAQALPHLFPELERSLRETEFQVSQDDRGHQTFRSALPIRQVDHRFHAASDGQLGGVMKAYRDWRIHGDTEWLRSLWASIKQSLEYCIETWDPRHTGLLEEPHHNTYDIEFWGPDGMCSSFYLGALAAACEMAAALGDPQPLYADLLRNGRAKLEGDLFNGEYFIQKVQWEGLRAKSPTEDTEHPPEALELLRKEGPKYQYGDGCLSDGVLGAWIGAVAGVPEFLDEGKVRSHLKAVHKHNLKHSLADHANPQRPTFAFGQEGGLLLCTWPRGGQLSLPFVYANEVWTGIEYQVASHLMLEGCVEEGLDIVRACRNRYDGRVRNPFNEYECGHWYARAMASYGLIQGLSGARYDAVERVLYIHPSIKGDFRSFLCTANGYATVGVQAGEPFIEVRKGSIEIDRIDYRPVD